MFRKRRKIHRHGRGTRTVFRGNTKNGRGRGSRMGRTAVKSKGGGKRNFMHVVKYEPERLNVKGFYSIHTRMRPVNLKDLDMSKGEIDVTALGYDKVLGAGKVNKAVTIKALSFTEGAKKKIESAGGKAIVLGESE